MTTIYGLSSSRNGLIRYIGKTSQPTEQRLNRHINNYGLHEPTYKGRWLKKEIEEGYVISIEEIEVVPDDQWEFWETYWISQFRAWGFHLVNTTRGGIGIPGDISLSRRRSETLKANNRERLKEQISLFKIKEENEIFTGERICPNCNRTCVHSSKKFPTIMALMRKSMSRLCTNCSSRLKISNITGVPYSGSSPVHHEREQNKIDFEERKAMVFSGSTMSKVHKSVEKRSHKRIGFVPIDTRKSVVQFNLSGDVVNTYSSVSEASKHCGITVSAISDVCNKRKKCKTAGGFVWRFSGDSFSLSYSNPAEHLRIPVHQYDKRGTLMNTYESMSEASKATGCSGDAISLCCKEKYTHSGGFKWKYA